jgi:hypothetical protein
MRPLAPFELHALRSQLDRHWRAAAAPAQKRLPGDKRREIVDIVAVILRWQEPTPFAGDGACRHGIRAALCLQGWSWTLADVTAADIVRSALARIGARRPTWAMGQPEWTQPGILMIARTRCTRCGVDLPEGHRRFCSTLCGAAYRGAIARRDADEATQAAQLAYQAARRKRLRDAQAPRPCDQCGEIFQPNRPEHRFCSTRCRNRNNGGLRRHV